MFATFIGQDGKINFAPRFSIYRKGIRIEGCKWLKDRKWY
jgi:hypothetical protein